MEEQTLQTPNQTSNQASTQTPTEAPSGNSDDHTDSPGSRTGTLPAPTAPPDAQQGLVPFVLVIIVLILSNIFFALAYFGDDDGDGDPDPNGGNGTVQPREQVIGELTVYQCYQLIRNNTNNSGFVIMDVRSSTDFEASRIHGAINIDYFNESFETYIRILDRNFTYLLYCDGGGISGLALEDMEALGYMEAYNMLNGFERWKELGYEVEGGDS